ncbi:MAG: hypothetical protein M1426_00750, partial [Patescibacteria group bacterium]|nr:hypothetical protein [Patescibacteria group bacterium]
MHIKGEVLYKFFNILTLLLLILFFAGYSYSSPVKTIKKKTPSANTIETTQKQIPNIKDGDEILPVKYIQPGMKGFGLTVFKGTKIDKFDVEIIGILKKAAFAGGDLILIKMNGGPITERKACIIGGMSGSPVYINGKLIGAVAYGWTNPREPFAMVTPIEDMLKSFNPELEKSRAQDKIKSYDLEQPVYINGQVIKHVNLDRANDPDHSVSSDTLDMIPLSMPVMVSGVSPKGMKYLQECLGDLDLMAMPGTGKMSVKEKIQFIPGASAGAALATGDMEMNGLGTLTYRKGNKVLAFGHPLTNSGTVQFPLLTAYVHDIFPSYVRSNKIMSPVEVIGTISQDRPWSIGGTIGVFPTMIPVTVTVHNMTTNLKKIYKVQVVDNDDITPGVVVTVLGDAMVDQHSGVEPATARVTMDIASTTIPSIKRENTFFDPTNIEFTALNDFKNIIGILYQNPLHPEHIKKIDFNVDITDADRNALIKKIFLKKDTFEPGENVEVGVVLKPYNDDTVVKTCTVRIPENTPDGSISLSVTGGINSYSDTLMNNNGTDSTAVSPLLSSTSVKEILNKFLDKEKNNDLVVRLALPGTVVRINGTRFKYLPNNLLDVMKSNKATGLVTEKNEVKSITTTDWIINGSQSLNIKVVKKGKTDKAVSTSSDSTSITSKDVSTPDPMDDLDNSSLESSKIPLDSTNTLVQVVSSKPAETHKDKK